MDKQPGFFSRLRLGSRGSDRNSLYRWFLANHDEFQTVMSGLPKPDWETVTAELKAEGLTLKSGGPLTAGYARYAWWKAKKAIAVQRQSSAKIQVGSQGVFPKFKQAKPRKDDIRERLPDSLPDGNAGEGDYTFGYVADRTHEDEQNGD